MYTYKVTIKYDEYDPYCKRYFTSGEVYASNDTDALIRFLKTADYLDEYKQFNITSIEIKRLHKIRAKEIKELVSFYYDNH